MLRTLTFLIVAVAAGCGVTLDEGTYRIVAAVTVDTCNNGALMFQLDLQNRGGTWTLQGSGLNLTGEEQDGELVLSETRSGVIDTTCSYTVTDRVILTPETSESFSGELTTFIKALCDGSTCTTTWALTGTKL